MGIKGTEGAPHPSTRLRYQLAVRCLRKWIGSCNPLVRAGHRDAEYEDDRDEHFYTSLLVSSTLGSFQGVDLRMILQAYFKGESLGVESLAVLKENAGAEWRHPSTGALIPPCAKVVVLEDAGRTSQVFGSSRKANAVAAYRGVYAELPTAESIRCDLQTLAALVRRVCFAQAPSGPGMGWHKAQIDYLIRVRRRPGLAKQSKTASLVCLGSACDRRQRGLQSSRQQLQPSAGTEPSTDCWRPFA